MLYPAEIKRRKALTCIRCQHQTCKRFGYFGKRRIQRWRCTSCKSTFSEAQPQSPLGAMRTSEEVAARAIQCLIEDCSIRSTERLAAPEKTSEAEYRNMISYFK